MKKRILVTLLLASGLLSLAFAYVQPVGQPAAEQAIRAASAAYATAFGKGDHDGVMAIWDDQAEYIDDDGTVTKGKAALSEHFKKTLAELKGWQLKLEGTALRMLAPNVAVADGVAHLTSPEGETESTHYTTIWTKQGDRWRLSSVRDLAAAAAPAVDGTALLKEMDWLVGDWSHEDAQAKVTLSCKRAWNSFLVFDYTIKSGDGSHEVKQWVGFDPREDALRSWTFDAAGGFGEGVWSKRGKVWRCRTTGVLPGGRDGEATNTLKQVDANAFIWKSMDRFVGDDALPDTEVKFTRVGAK